MQNRRLFLMRHAHAESQVGYGDDADRARRLTSAGEEEARKIGHDLTAGGFLEGPLTFWSSPAQRTRQTAALIQEKCAPDSRISVVGELYSAGADEILDLIRHEAPATSSLLIIGHNPFLYHLALQLAGRALDQQVFSSLNGGYPPASVTVFSVTQSWDRFGPANARLDAFLTP